MLYFTSGPVNMEFAGGILDNWHLEIYNNSNSSIPVKLTVFDINNALTPIGNTTRSVDPHTHEYASISTNGTHHTMVQVEYPEGVGEIILTLYGRDKNSRALPGAIFFSYQLMPQQYSLEPC